MPIFSILLIINLGGITMEINIIKIAILIITLIIITIAISYEKENIIFVVDKIVTLASI